jgi:hypothetical protein
MREAFVAPFRSGIDLNREYSDSSLEQEPEVFLKWSFAAIAITEMHRNERPPSAILSAEYDKDSSYSSYPYYPYWFLLQ